MAPVFRGLEKRAGLLNRGTRQGAAVGAGLWKPPACGAAEADRRAAEARRETRRGPWPLAPGSRRFPEARRRRRRRLRSRGGDRRAPERRKQLIFHRFNKSAVQKNIPIFARNLTQNLYEEPLRNGFHFNSRFI